MGLGPQCDGKFTRPWTHSALPVRPESLPPSRSAHKNYQKGLPASHVYRAQSWAPSPWVPHTSTASGHGSCSLLSHRSGMGTLWSHCQGARTVVVWALQTSSSVGTLLSVTGVLHGLRRGETEPMGAAQEPPWMGDGKHWGKPVAARIFCCPANGWTISPQETLWASGSSPQAHCYHRYPLFLVAVTSKGNN